MIVESKGVPEAVTDLRALAERGSDIRRVSEQVRSVYRRSNERRFDGSAGWAGLAESTRERKTREGLDSRPMRATGALYRALTEPRASGQVDEREPTEFRFGVSLYYAHFSRGTKTEPERDLIDLSVRERHEIDDLISTYVSKGRASTW